MLDASVIAKLIMREEDYYRAAKEIELDGETLDLALMEVSNVVLKYYRRGEITLQEAWEKLEELIKLSSTLKVLRFRDFLKEAFELATSVDITIYDSLYIISSTKLVTADAKQAEIAKQQGKNVILI